MMVLLRNAIAIVRGLLVKVFASIASAGRIKIGKCFRFFKGSILRFRKQGNATLGDYVKVDRDTMLAVNGGNLALENGVSVGCRCIIVCLEHISIGENTMLAPNVMIYDHDHACSKENGVQKTAYKTGKVIIGKNCWIGAGTTILRDTEIGDNCIVGAGSVLKGVYPSGSKIVQKRETSIL